VRVYSNKDSDAGPVLEKISKYTQQAEAMKLPYWVFVEDSNPVGIVAVGKEPIQLLAPPGTPMAIIRTLDNKQPAETLRTLALNALELGAKSNIEYAMATFPSNEDEAIEQFKKAGYLEFDDCYRMVCKLDNVKEPLLQVEFVPVVKEEMRHFVKAAQEFLQGSPDITLTEALKHMAELPDDFLSFYYSTEKFYFANENHRTVGILNFNPSKGLISNVGVNPLYRGKGIGRQIVLFGLDQLRKSGCNEAYLRVHVDNSPAIRLYESLGFVKSERYKTLIWRRTS
jgi:ribosomal protein S18 acetylase RimI-like enzyme